MTITDPNRPVVDPRKRLTEGFNKARFQLELRRGLRPSIGVLAVTAVAVVGFVYMLAQIAPTLLTSTYEAKFRVRSAAFVVPHVNEVRIKGIPVGTIEKIDTEDDQATLTVKIEKRYGRIYRDARAQLRPNTALNDMYLDIVDRGSPAAGVLGENESLPRAQTETPVNVDDVLNVFAPSQRLRLRTLLDDLGHGLEDGGESLRAVFVQLVPFIRNAGEMADQLAERGPLVARLVHNADTLTQELGDRETQLRLLMTEGGATLRTLQQGSPDLDATLRELPPTLATVSHAFAAVRGTLDDVDGAVRSLYPVADRLPSSLTDLRRIAIAAGPAVSKLREPISDLVPFARSLRPLTSRLDRASAALAPQIDTVDKVTRDLALCKKGFQNFFQWNASISKFGDIRGPIPRGNVVFGAQSSSFFADPNEYAPEACSPGKVIGGRVPEPKDMH